MKHAVQQATENFCSTILETSPKNGKSPGKSFYGAAVSLYENNDEHIWYLLFKRPTLNRIAKNLLLEENLHEDDLNDLLKEVSNQIIGSAKVILEEKNPHHSYTLSVPEFMGNIQTPFPFKLKEHFVYKINHRTFIIGKQ
jgi:hypothetical protein